MPQSLSIISPVEIARALLIPARLSRIGIHENDDFNLIYLGPGEYEYTGTLQKTKRGDVMCFKDARFKPLKISTPGPGAYEAS